MQIYIVLNFYTLIVCKCLSLSFEFCVFLPETRDILMHVNFDKYPELDMYSETTIQNNIFSKIIFHLNRQEILQTLAVRNEATYDDLAEKKRQRKLRKEDLEDDEAPTTKLEYVTEIDSAYWTRQTRIKFGCGVIWLFLGFTLMVLGYFVVPIYDFNV